MPQASAAVKGRASALPWAAPEILRRLEPLCGPAEAPRGYDAVSELVYTILSQNTSDRNSTRAYDRLRQAFPTWAAVADADSPMVIEAIKVGGLAQIKGPRIQRVLRELRSRRGASDLSFLREMPLEDAKAWLRQLPGVGPKTVACVLLFALGRPALPVDTHVYRVAKRLGLLYDKVDAERSHQVLEAMLKPEQVLPFHIYLITHGRMVCKAQRPLCGQCVLEERCPSSTLKSNKR